MDISLLIHKYRLKRKEKNKSREEIFYQMKFFFCLDHLKEVFFVNRPGAHNQLSMFSSCASSIRETHRNSEELHN